MNRPCNTDINLLVHFQTEISPGNCNATTGRSVETSTTARAMPDWRGYINPGPEGLTILYFRVLHFLPWNLMRYEMR